MIAGTISGNHVITNNTTYSGGGGVFVNGITGNPFSKTGGIIYGDTNTVHTADSDENTASNGNGHAVYCLVSSSRKRNATAGPDVNLDSTVSGSSGGWE
jgi:hypothetical protein